MYAGRTVTTTNAKLQRSTAEQNPAGLTTRVTDDAGGVIEHLYDAIGRLLQTFTEEEVEGKRTRLVTSFEYDALGRKTKMTDPSMGTWEYGYTVFGELKWQRDAKGTVVTLQYDALGRKLEQKAQVADANAPPGTLRTVERTQWIYDAFAEGQPVAWNGALLCTKFFGTDASPKWTERVTALDALGRVLSTSRSFEGKTFVTAGTYDAYGRPETYRYPSGFETRNVYAPQGHLSWIEAKSSGLRYWEAEEIDAEGRVVREKLGNGLVSASTFDPRTGMLAELKTEDPSKAVVVQHNRYQFDPLGNLKSRSEQLGGKSEAFVYDTLNRLVQSTVAGQGAKAYRYSIGGNLLGKAGVEYRYEAQRPHAVREVSGPLKCRYEYDANGNMTRSEALKADGTVDLTQSRKFEYAWHNKPTRIEKGLVGVVAVDYEYGPSEERIFQCEIDFSDSTTPLNRCTYYAGSFEQIEDYGSGGQSDVPVRTTLRHYIGGVAILDHVEEDGRKDVRTSYVLGDHLGSTEVVTDAGGAVVERYSFDAFGLKRNAATWEDLPAGNVQPRSEYTRQGYTGHEQLESVGLIHMGGRVYDPVLGRFTSADPVVQAPENLQSYNRYSYCVNNPLSLTDPSGYSWLSKAFKKIGSFFSKTAKKIGRWVKQNWRQIVVVVVAIVVACVTYGYGLTLVGGANATFAAKAAVVTAAGAASGATRGGLSAALYGGSASDILKASLKGAVVGGVTAALTFGVAHGGVEGVSIFGSDPVGIGATVAAEAAIGGAASVAEGGDFLSGAIGSLGGGLGELSGGGFLVRTAISAAAGGTAAEVGGGSFENGAISGAYTYMFNHAASELETIVVTGTSTPGSEYGLIDGVQDALSVLGLVPFAGDVVDGINALIYLARGQHAEAAMSAAAMVPFGGIVATGLRLSKRLGKLFKAAKKGNGLGNPFKGKTAAEIDEMFKAKGFKPRGPSPLNGKGGYVNPKTRRSYHIDEANSFGEPPHVDVNRPKTYDGPLDKKKYRLGN